jgi:hypothetical protein
MIFASARPALIHYTHSKKPKADSDCYRYRASRSVGEPISVPFHAAIVADLPTERTR